jgi:hypothetical protein
MISISRITEKQRIAQTLGVVVGATSRFEQVTEERDIAVVATLR